MVHRSLKIVFALGVLVASFSHTAYAQDDRVYKTDGSILIGKVTEVTPADIKFIQKNRPEGVVYYIRTSLIDSIIYSNGAKDVMQGATGKKKLLENIPQRNTWSFDVLGLTYLSISQSYERRTQDGKIGFRVPFYLGFIGGGFAGEGIFQPNQGLYHLLQYNSSGFSVASGFNPRFYLFKRRIVRAFAGPEVTIGYGKSFSNNYDQYGNYYSILQRYGTVGMMGKFGLMINPTDKFNIGIEGGAGAGNMFGSPYALGWVGLWHIGLSFGTNF
jgi:hypothetical protein